jgi:assimilatory nitrate reductase catalytic subunit
MDGETKTVCPYCGVGCGLLASVRDGRIVAVRGDPEHPSTAGRLCLKGALVGPTVDAPTRLREAMIRGAGGRLEPVPRGRAVAEAASRLGGIHAEHGPEAVAFYAVSRATPT